MELVLKKHVVALCFFFALSEIVHAGGLAEPIIDPPLPEPAQPFSWEGPYVGGHIGGVWGTQKDNQSDVISNTVCADGETLVDGVCVLDGDPPSCGLNEVYIAETATCECRDGYIRNPESGRCIRPGDKFSLNGLLAGIHAGRNWQRGSFVYGVEADLDLATLQGGTDFDYGAGVTGRLSYKTDWQGSMRLRAGVAKGTSLFYGTGGVAFGHGKLTGTSPGFAQSDAKIHVGWTLGAGVEKAFNRHWIGRVEARYTDFGNKSYNLGTLGNGVNSGWTQTSVTVGLSYKF